MKLKKFLSFLLSAALVFTTLTATASADDAAVIPEEWETAELSYDTWKGENASVETYNPVRNNEYLQIRDPESLSGGVNFKLTQTFEAGTSYEITFKMRAPEDTDESHRSIRMWVQDSQNIGTTNLYYQGPVDVAAAKPSNAKDGFAISEADAEGWRIVTVPYTPTNEETAVTFVICGDTTGNNNKYGGTGVAPLDFDDFAINGQPVSGSDFTSGVKTDAFAWTKKGTVTHAIESEKIILTENDYLAVTNISALGDGVLLTLDGDFNSGERYLITFRVKSDSVNSPRTVRCYINNEQHYGGQLDATRFPSTLNTYPSVKNNSKIESIETDGWYIATLDYRPTQKQESVVVKIIGDTYSKNKTLTPVGNGVTPFFVDDIKVNGVLVKGGDFSENANSGSVYELSYKKQGSADVETKSETSAVLVDVNDNTGYAEYRYDSPLPEGTYRVIFDASIFGYDVTVANSIDTTGDAIPDYAPSVAVESNWREIDLKLFDGSEDVTELYDVTNITEGAVEGTLPQITNDWSSLVYEFTIPEGTIAKDLSIRIGGGSDDCHDYSRFANFASITDDPINDRDFMLKNIILAGEVLKLQEEELAPKLNSGIVMLMLVKMKGEGGKVSKPNAFLSTLGSETLSAGTQFTVNDTFKAGQAYTFTFKLRAPEDTVTSHRSIRMWVIDSVNTKTQNENLYYRGSVDGTAPALIQAVDGCTIGEADENGWRTVTVIYTPTTDEKSVSIGINGDTTGGRNDQYGGTGVSPLEYDDFTLNGELVDGGDFSDKKATKSFSWKALNATAITIAVKEEKSVVEASDKQETSYLSTHSSETLSAGMKFSFNDTFKAGQAYTFTFKLRAPEDTASSHRSIRMWVIDSVNTKTQNENLYYRGSVDGTAPALIQAVDGCTIGEADENGWRTVTVIYTPTTDEKIVSIGINGDTTGGRNDQYGGTGVSPLEYDDFALNGELVDGGDFSDKKATKSFAWEPLNGTAITYSVKDHTN